MRVTVDAAGIAVAYDDGVYPAEGGNPCLSAMPYLLAEGMLMDGRSHNEGQADARYKFVGNERDVETGFDYLGDRSYDSRIGRWGSVDPLAAKYPHLSPYDYVANNPLVLVDPTGMDISTHADKDGNVLAVYDDGDLGVYKHENVKTKDDVDKSRKQAGSTSGDGEEMGETDYWDEFLDSGSNPAGTIMFGSSWDGEIENRHQQSLSMDLYTIMKNSTHGGIFDIKVGRSFEGRRLAGKYASARSAGN